MDIADKNNNKVNHVTPRTITTSTVQVKHKHARTHNKHKAAEIAHKLSDSSPVIKPMGGKPTGPIAKREQLTQQYGKLFAKNPKGVHFYYKYNSPT